MRGFGEFRGVVTRLIWDRLGFPDGWDAPSVSRPARRRGESRAYLAQPDDTAPAASPQSGAGRNLPHSGSPRPSAKMAA